MQTKTDDVNIRIDRASYRRLKMNAAKYSITLKETVGILSLAKFPVKI